LPGRTSTGFLKPIGADIRKAFNRLGLLPEAQASWVMTAAEKVARGRFRATLFRDGELVCTAGTLPAAELQIKSHLFREAINKELGREIVRSILFKQR
jgi:hypothetical protein